MQVLRSNVEDDLFAPLEQLKAWAKALLQRAPDNPVQLSGNMRHAPRNMQRSTRNTLQHTKHATRSVATYDDASWV